jgi:hypothetical protein
MGAHKSKLVTNYSAPDTLFIDKGCIGLTRKEYSSDKRLYSAPFYNVKIIANDYYDLVNQVLAVFKNPPPMPDVDSSRQVPSPAPIYGPVYLFTAYDAEAKVIEACLLFPSMHRDRNKWSNYFELGTYHRWIYRLIYSTLYAVKPMGACGLRIDNWPDPLRTTDSNGKVHISTPYFKYNLMSNGHTTLVTKPWYDIKTDSTTGEQTATRAADPHPVLSKTLHSGFAGINTTTITTREIFAGEPNNLQYGCRSESSPRCIQSTDTHKAMGIYRSSKSPSLYPSAYFRMYQLNTSDARIHPYMSSDSTELLYRNILPEYLDLTNGCKYMLISPNGKCVFALGSTRIGIYKTVTQVEMNAKIIGQVNAIMKIYQRWKFPQAIMNILRNRLIQIMGKSLKVCGENRFPSFERRFPGNLNVRGVIEDGMLNVYSKEAANSDDFVVYSLQVAPDNVAGPIALVLDNSGQLLVYDKNNVATVLIDANGALSTSDNGTSSPWIGDLNAELNGSDGSDGFDTSAHFRQRLHNLKVYLKLINDFVENQIGISPLADINPPSELLSNIGAYDDNVDYTERYDAFLDYLRNNGLIDYATYTSHYIYKTHAASINGDGRSQTAATARGKIPTLPGLDGSFVTSQEVMSALDAMDATNESVSDDQDQDAKAITANEEANEQKRKKANEDAQNQQNDIVAAIAEGTADPTNTQLDPAPDFPVRTIPNTPGIGFGDMGASGSAIPPALAGFNDTPMTPIVTSAPSPDDLGWNTYSEYTARMHNQFNI